LCAPPVATINKLLAEALPADLKLSAEVRDMFTECCTGAPRACQGRVPRRAEAKPRPPAEFVNLLSSEANELCEKGKKKTVGPEHVLEAMEARTPALALLRLALSRWPRQALGFSSYSPEVNAALEAWKTEDKALGARRAKLKGKDTGMSVEEAAAAQAQLFAAARASCYGEQAGAGGAGPS
jgi:hypothetical protein